MTDILIVVVDGLRGFPEAIEAFYPEAQIQTCIVHLIRNPINFASWKDRKALAAASSLFTRQHNGRCGGYSLGGFCGR